MSKGWLGNGVEWTAKGKSCSCCSVAQLRSTLCDPMDSSTPGFLVHHQLPELAQTHVHCFGDAIQPSHLLSFPSPPAFNLSQHQSLFQWISSSHEVAKVLELQLQHQFLEEYSGLISFKTGLISLLSKGLSRVFSSITVRKHQFFKFCLLYCLALTFIHDSWKDHSLEHTDLHWQSDVFAF